jgi:hypothetical protein
MTHHGQRRHAAMILCALLLPACGGGFSADFAVRDAGPDAPDAAEAGATDAPAADDEREAGAHDSSPVDVVPPSEGGAPHDAGAGDETAPVEACAPLSAPLADASACAIEGASALNIPGVFERKSEGAGSCEWPGTPAACTTCASSYTCACIAANAQGGCYPFQAKGCTEADPSQGRPVVFDCP